MVLDDDVSTLPCPLSEATHWNTESDVRVSTSASADGKTSSAGTPSPSFLFNLSIFAQRKVASEGISKLGALGGPNAANEIVLGLCRCVPEELSLAMASKGGLAGIVSSVGLTDAVVDGGP